MSEPNASVDRFWGLLDAACDGSLNESQVQELATLLDSDQQLRKLFAHHLQLRTDIGFLCRAERTGELGITRIQAARQAASPSSHPPVVVLVDRAVHGTPSYFSSDWPLAYLTSTVICALGLWILSLIPVSHPTQFAGSQAATRSTGQTDAETNANADAESPKPTSFSSEFRPLIGQITGMVDCKWSDDSTFAFDRAYVPLGRKYALSSGVMEITYDTGAKVLLQGPCTYEVESPAGGYLSVGKLTARVEKKVASDQWPVASESKVRGPSLITNHQPLATSVLSPLHSPLFTIKTPTAAVTDLGTEFGVEVDSRGQTTSHVFRGSVEVRVVTANGEPVVLPRVLHEYESATVKKVGESHTVVLGSASTPIGFVRSIPKTTVKTLDLLDIVAGGNGMGHRRERGIDPTTCMEDPVFVRDARHGDGRYHRGVEYRFVDGVFVPDGREPVILDSAGHTCDLPPTSGRMWGSIWPRAAAINQPSDIANYSWNWIYAMGPGKQFMPKGNGLLGMHANAGITFNLAAMRNTGGNARPARFLAVAGLADAYAVDNVSRGMADIWVFVDGRLKLKHEKLRPKDGPTEVNVAIAPEDRFLTLVVTDGGDGDQGDWVVFGDPVFEMACEEVTK